jgi:hypothetical protein
MGGPKYNKLKSHTLFRSESVKPLDKSLFNRSRINSITVFGSMKAVDDMSVTNHARREGAWDESTRISKALPDVRNCEASVWSGMITIPNIQKALPDVRNMPWLCTSCKLLCPEQTTNVTHVMPEAVKAHI